jgi:2-oxoglutarate ferredoxin oxidoreductase subunit beta
MPRPFGVLYADERPVYDEDLQEQMETIVSKKGKVPLSKILSGDKTWNIM